MGLRQVCALALFCALSATPINMFQAMRSVMGVSSALGRSDFMALSPKS